MNERETFRDSVQPTGFDGHPNGVLGGVFRNITSHIQVPRSGSHPGYNTNLVRYNIIYIIVI